MKSPHPEFRAPAEALATLAGKSPKLQTPLNLREHPNTITRLFAGKILDHALDGVGFTNAMEYLRAYAFCFEYQQDTAVPARTVRLIDSLEDAHVRKN